MRIRSVLLNGYKNLSDVQIKFDRITALVALNNFGKSNVLSGIDFGIKFITAKTNEKEELMASSNLIPLNRNMENRNFIFEMELTDNSYGKEFLVQYGYEFEWKMNEDKDPEIVCEFLKYKSSEKGQKFTQLINRTDTVALYKSSETGRCSSKIKIESTELVVNKLLAFDDLYYSKIISGLNNLKIYMENNLDARSFYQPDPIIRRGLENEMINADNLPRVIFKLKELNPEKFELLKNVYYQLFPDVEDILVKKIEMNGSENNQFPDELPFVFTDTIYALYVKDRNLERPVNFSLMSDGAKRVFMILTKIIVSSISDVSLIAIEEPENSVHPGLFHDYIQIVGQLLDDCKVIITSHSPYIISYLDPSWIHVGVNGKEGVARFFSFKKSGQKQLENDAQKFEMSTGDYLFSLLADPESNLNDYLEVDSNA